MVHGDWKNTEMNSKGLPLQVHLRMLNRFKYLTRRSMDMYAQRVDRRLRLKYDENQYSKEEFGTD